MLRLQRRGGWIVVELGLRTAIGLEFVYAGWSKVGDPLGFADSVASFAILPNAIVSIFALALPIFEIIAGLLILGGRPRRIGAAAVFVLSLIFVIALAQALARGLDVNCGCFGPGASTTNPWIDLVRNLFTVAGCAIIYVLQARAKA
ncbi:MAG TPA: MauE/DoxX family redox-associated membrane protein [Candidatus Binataceae bacterium]|jgi:uncharacterized membrane protein YphA (DoxX/SURF4 family)|nr:MauE/DoxX family redox-associated membrane protein [Candidatus Binataceae bacterium]